MEESSLIPKRTHVLMELINISNGIQGKTKLQKMMFLAKQEYGVEHEYKFEKYNYGPYSFQLSEDLKALQSLEFIKVDETIFDTEGPFIGKLFIFSLSDKGKEIMEKIIPQISGEDISKLTKLVNDWNSKPLPEIIDYVYSHYM
jgi:hypothetical protein